MEILDKEINRNLGEREKGKIQESEDEEKG
jgi:hypothetical protein